MKYYLFEYATVPLGDFPASYENYAWVRAESVERATEKLFYSTGVAEIVRVGGPFTSAPTGDDLFYIE